MGIVVAAVQSEGFLMNVKGYLAGSVVLASVGSLVSHRVLDIWSGPRSKGTSGTGRDPRSPANADRI